MQLIKMEDLFKIHNTDARNISNVIKDDMINVAITSPPYFDMKDYGYKGQIGYGQSYGEYLEDIKKVFKNIYDVTKDDGVLWVVIDTFKKDDEVVPLPFDFSNKISEIGWKLQDIIIWNKDKTVPWSKKGQTKNKFEYILLFSKSKNFKYYTDRVREYNTKFLKKWWIKYPERYNPKGKAPEEIWNYDIPTQGSWGNGYIRHFCPLPTDIVGKMIQLTSDEGDIILDPFAGSGSVLAQAAYMKRKYIGFELNAEYVGMFHKYLKKSLKKGLKNYEILKNGRYSQDIFEQTILNLRALKFAKTLRNNLKRTIRDLIDVIYVEISKDKPIKNYKIIKVNYEILLNVNPSEKSPTFMLWDESHGRFFKTLQAFSSLGRKPCHLWHGRGTKKVIPAYQDDTLPFLRNEIDQLITNPPLSKYGIEPIINFHFSRKRLFKNFKKPMYLYNSTVTHKFFKKYIPGEKIDKFVIMSPIMVNINEDDFE